MAHSLAVFRALSKDGGVDLAKAASFVAGHSLGEYSAPRRARSRFWRQLRRCSASRAGDAGSCAGRRRRDGGARADLALAQKIADAAAQGEVCTVANDNDPTQVVISGHKGAIDRAIEIAKDMGAKRAIALPVRRNSFTAPDAAGSRGDGGRFVLCRDFAARNAGIPRYG